MAPRLQLHEILTGLVANVYFQPPSNIQMVYPAIVYRLEGNDVDHADNSPYRLTKRYQVTVITRDPDSAIADELALLPMCRLSNAYTADQLHHYAFTLFF